MFVRTCSFRVCGLGSFCEIYSRALWLVGFAGFQLVLIGLFKDKLCPNLCHAFLSMFVRACLVRACV